MEIELQDSEINLEQIAQDSQNITQDLLVRIQELQQAQKIIDEKRFISLPIQKTIFDFINKTWFNKLLINKLKHEYLENWSKAQAIQEYLQNKDQVHENIYNNIFKKNLLKKHKNFQVENPQISQDELKLKENNLIQNFLIQNKIESLLKTQENDTKGEKKRSPKSTQAKKSEQELQKHVENFAKLFTLEIQAPRLYLENYSKQIPSQNELLKNFEQQQKKLMQLKNSPNFYNYKSEFQQNQENLGTDIKQLFDKEQSFLRNLLVTNDSQLNFSLDFKSPKLLHYVAGVDISFDKNDKSLACSQLTILEYPSMKLVYEDHEFVKLDIPYVSGFLAFRECAHILKLFEKLMKFYPQFIPQVILCDGNGVLHQNGCGFASHLGLLLDIPSIGVGKTCFFVDGLSSEKIMTLYDENCRNFGDFVKLKGKSGNIWGAVLKTSKKTKNVEDPIIVSIGHKISLDSAITIVKYCTYKGIIPKPIYEADKLSRKFIRDIDYFHRSNAVINILPLLHHMNLNDVPNEVYENNEIYSPRDTTADKQYNFADKLWHM